MPVGYYEPFWFPIDFQGKANFDKGNSYRQIFFWSGIWSCFSQVLNFQPTDINFLQGCLNKTVINEGITIQPDGPGYISRWTPAIGLSHIGFFILIGKHLVWADPQITSCMGHFGLYIRRNHQHSKFSSNWMICFRCCLEVLLWCWSFQGVSWFRLSVLDREVV